MVDPIIGGALIGAGANIIGGIASHFSGRSQASMQKRFAKRGISWRVKDAKRAGLHPLYALGAQVPSYSPVSDSLGESLSAAGQNIGNAIASRMTPVQKKLVDLELAQAEANLNKTYEEQAFIRSERLRNINSQFQWLPEPNVKESGGSGSFIAGQVSTKLPPPGLVKQDAATSFSTLPGDAAVAGLPTPSMRVFTLPGGLPIMLPGGMSGDPSEALETLSESPLLMWSVYKVNRDKYGAEWASKFRRQFLWGDTFEKFWMWSARNRSGGSRPPPPPRGRTRLDYR